MSNEAAIKAAVYEMGLLFNQQPTPERINAYARHLSRFSPEQIVFAFKCEIARGSAFFPSLAEVLSHLRPVEISADSLAADAADEIMRAVVDYARVEDLSPLAQAVIGSTAALRQLGEAPASQMPNNKAQLRMKAKAVVEKQRAQNHDAKLKRLGLLTGADADHGNLLGVGG